MPSSKTAKASKRRIIPAQGIALGNVPSIDVSPVGAGHPPAGWRWVTLREIAEISGGVTKGQKRKPHDFVRSVPYLRVANVQSGYIGLTEVKEIEVAEREIQAHPLLPGDILFNEGGDRDKLGRGWVWKGEIKECVHQNHVFRARLRNPDDSPKFVSYYGNSGGKQYFFDQGTSNAPPPAAVHPSESFTLKENSLKRADLDDFVDCYFGKSGSGVPPLGSGKGKEDKRRDAASTLNRHDRKETDRFKAFAYEDLIKRDKINLDIFWLKDDALEESANLPAPGIIALDIMEDLQAALEQFATIAEDLK